MGHRAARPSLRSRRQPSRSTLVAATPSLLPGQVAPPPVRRGEELAPVADQVQLDPVPRRRAARADFRGLWGRHDVQEELFGHKRIRHPLLGEIVLQYETLAVAGGAGDVLVAYAAAAGSAEEALRLLGSWSAYDR